MKAVQKWPWPRALTLGLSLKARAILGTLLPVAAIVIYFGQNQHAQKHLAKTTHEILDQRITMMDAAERIKQGLVAYDDALFRYLAIQDPDQLNETQHWRRQAQENLARLRELSTSPLIRARLDTLQHETDQYFLDAEQLADYAKKTQASANDLQRQSNRWNRETGRGHLELAFLSAEGKARLIRVFSLCEEIATINRLELERAQADMNRVLEEAKQTGAAMSLIAIGTLALLAGGFILSLLTSLRNLLYGIRQIEGGDLAVEIPVLAEDEVGELTRAFNHATGLIRQQREQLLQETITDGLTGIYNQRHFRTILRQEVERAHRAEGALSLLMIDIDHFKEYNDTYGHEFGNELLKKVSALIRETVRDIDALARYGGDEFAVILPQANADNARTLAQRILEAVSVHGAMRNRSGLSVPTLSVSIGGASYPADGQSAEALIHRADDALYQAKNAGRACVRWPSGPEPASALEVAPQ